MAEEEDLSDQGMRLRFSNASDMRRVAAFLLSEQRCEMTGVLGMTDTALLKEMLQFHTRTHCWDAATVGPGITVSPDRASVGVSVSWNGFFENARSVDPTDDFTVRVTNRILTARFIARVSIGFTTRSMYRRKRNMVYPAEDWGVYAYCPMGGSLWGSGKYGVLGYSAPCDAPQCTVRCVADRRCGTISFYVDGVHCGVAWTDISPEPLYAFAMFCGPGVDVEFV